MADTTQSSRRYAKALVQSSSNDEELAALRAELLSFAEAIESAPDLTNILTNPVFTAIDRQNVLERVMTQLSLSEKVQRFLKLLTERGRADQVGEVAKVFRTLADQRAGRLLAEVQSASQLSDTTLEQLKRALEKRTGKAIELAVTVDQSLIGGIRTKVGSLVFDGTIRSELERLKDSLSV